MYLIHLQRRHKSCEESTSLSETRLAQNTSTVYREIDISIESLSLSLYIYIYIYTHTHTKLPLNSLNYLKIT